MNEQWDVNVTIVRHGDRLDIAFKGLLIDEVDDFFDQLGEPRRTRAAMECRGGETNRHGASRSIDVRDRIIGMDHTDGYAEAVDNIKKRAAEYRPSMDVEVLHSWAKDMVTALAWVGLTG